MTFGNIILQFLRWWYERRCKIRQTYWILLSCGQQTIVTILKYQKQVGMAEWAISRCLDPVRRVVGLILGHDILWKAIEGASGPCKIVFDRRYQTGICMSVRFVGRQPLSETGLLPSSRALLPVAACASGLGKLSTLPSVSDLGREEGRRRLWWGKKK